jgi:hypothetical protein
VHVTKSDGIMIVNLGSKPGEETVRVNHMKHGDARHAMEIVAKDWQIPMDGWRGVHGD